MVILAATLVSCSQPAFNLPMGRRGQNEFLAQVEVARSAEALRLVRYADAVMRLPGGTERAGTAILVLGRTRADAAVPFLVENITFFGIDPLAAGGARSPDAQYPCAAALGDIGAPAVSAVVAAAEKSDDADRHHMTAFVVVRALGPELAADYLARRRAKLPAGPARDRVAAVDKLLPRWTAVEAARDRYTGPDPARQRIDPPRP